MKVCIVAEGCYPYVVGGVSSWIHSMINSFSDVEFEVLSIISERSDEVKFKYEMLPNVVSVHEVYLNDIDWSRSKRHKKIKLTKEQNRALRSVILDYKTDWDVLFDLFQNGNVSVDSLLMGEAFLRIVEECYEQKYSQIVFSDFLWTMRSIYLPLFLILSSKIPEADVYHCVSTGYAGVLGSMAKHQYGSRLLVSEHGIYTREREEEILKATWVNGIYKNIWIDQFRKMSALAYERAEKVTALYGHARELQIELGCNPKKTVLTPNGINPEKLANLPGKTEEEEAFVNIGAVLRVTPIKDVKTMIRAFAFAKERVPEAKLWIMGPEDEDPDYADECHELVEVLGVKDVIFTGRINIKDYLGKMDFTILTSISEGQPLTILEGYAAGKAAIATNVGNCKGLIYGEEGDEFGTAGILTHVMNVEEIADAIIYLCKNKEKREEMGWIGYKRVTSFYTIDQMRAKYRAIYDELDDRRK